MLLKENERIDYVNDSLSLIQKPDGLTFGTDALLLAGFIVGKYRTGVELGGGSGIISMLLLARNKLVQCDAVEIQEEYADLIRRNAELNKLSDRLSATPCDIRDYKCEAECDIVFTNPPYMKATSGSMCNHTAKTVARHEIHGDIADFATAAGRILKHGGCFAAVYRPDRLVDLLCAMRNAHLEPKRITFVHSDTESEASIVLVEAKKGAKSGNLLTRPLIIYKDKAHKEYSDDMNYIMENGSFPPYFKR